MRKSDLRLKLEISGGLTLERLPLLAKLGADYVSFGALTHAACAMDPSLEVRTTTAGEPMA